MKKLLITLLVALPAGAQAMGMHGGMRYGQPQIGLHFAAALYALMAALGYWILQHAAGQTAKSVRGAGKTVAWFLIVFGLLGLLCGVNAHVRRYTCGSGGWHEARGAEAGGPADPNALQVQVKVEKPAPAKK